jgi:streptogramin lyase
MKNRDSTSHECRRASLPWLRRHRALIVSAITGCALALPALATGPVCERTYTLDADFEEGIVLNLNHDPSDQLQLNQITEPFPFVNIACSGRGTIVRIDVNSGQILGEYLTAPDGMGRNPSRTTVDRLGNVWVANRDESSGGRGSVARIGLVIGGIRCNADGTDNPAGEYLKPPFQYNTAVDRDGDGLIRTSTGLGNILPWSNAGNADSNGGVSTAADECIINYVRVVGTGTRTVAVDANNDVWVGGLNNTAHEKLDGVTGQPVPGTQFNVGAGGYGGLIDGNGVLWSARGGSGLLRFVPNPAPPPAGTATGLGNGWGNYGLGIDPATGNIWHTDLGGGRVYVYLPNGTPLASHPQGDAYAQGVAVDGSGNVWVAHSLYRSTVGHLRTDGTYVGTIAVGNGPTGVAVDANGKVWVANINSSTAQRIDPALGPIGGGGFPVGAVDLTVNLGAGASPYNYSDMTGFVAIGATSPSGSWDVIYDSTALGTEWGTVSWTGYTPPGTTIKVEIRAADVETDLPSLAFVEVQNGVDFCGAGVAGQLLEVRASLSHDATTMESPILYDLTVKCCNQPPVALCQDVTVSAGADCSADASVDNGSYDPDSDPITLTQSPGGPYPLGTTEVTLTVVDDQGASASCTASVTVVDTTPPQIACPADVTAPTDAGLCSAVVAFPEPEVADNCGIASVVCNPPSGSVFPKGDTVVTCTVTDTAGLTAECTFTVTVNDTEAPTVLAVPTNNPSGGGSPNAWAGFYELTGTDNCDAALIYIQDTGSSAVFGPFASGIKVKLTQAPGATPSQAPMAGDIAWHIRLKGDALVYAVDGSGNTSANQLVSLTPKKK